MSDDVQPEVNLVAETPAPEPAAPEAPAPAAAAEEAAVETPVQATEAPNTWATFDFSGSLTDVSRRAQGEAERRKIEQTLKEAGGNKGRASELLGVSYKTLLMKLKDYGIE